MCLEYLRTRAPQLTDAVVEHIWITVASVLLGLLVAFPLALLARRYRKLEGFVVGTTTAIYTIPSLALFSLLLPVTGLTPTTVGSIVGYGGLGNLLLEAVDSQFKAQVLTAGVLCVLLAVAFDLVVVGAQWLLTPWTRTRRAG